MYAVPVLVMCQNEKFYGTLKFLFNTGPYGAGIFKTLQYSPTFFISCQPNFMRALGYYGGIQAITFLANRPSFKNLWHLEILTWESMEKTKMWNIWKTADHRVKTFDA